MHIVFLSHEYPLWSPGGAGTFIQTFGREAVREGHQITIIGAGKSSEEIQLYDEGVVLYRMPKSKNIIPDFVHNAKVINRKIREIHSKNPIDILESAELGMAFISRRQPIKKVIRLHGGHHFFAEAEKRGINWRKGLVEKMSFKKADAFIAVSKYVKEHTSKYLSYHDKPLEIINYPIDTQKTPLEHPTKNNQILFAGTICEKKGVRELLKAFQLVRQKYPKKELHLFGRDWFYPNGDSYIETLKKELDNSIFEHVYFHGSVPRDVLDTHYSEASICVFPSHMETQGLVCLEAMLLEKPVVFSKYGPGPETINHAVTGLLCDVYEPNDIARKIIWYIENPEEAKLIGVKARKAVLEKYDKASILQKNIAFYQSLLP